MLNLGNGYPLGPLYFHLASLTTLLGTDVAWRYQSYVASVAIALGAIPAARLLADLGLPAVDVRPRRLRRERSRPTCRSPTALQGGTRS